MKVDELAPLIFVLLIVVVSLLRAIFRAFSATKRKPAGPQRPGVWGEFKKALKDMAEQQREGGPRRVEPEEDEGGALDEEEPSPTAREEPAPVVIVTPVRSVRRGMSERTPSAREAIPVVTPVEPVRHRPEELGTSIAQEVADIVHPPVEEHLKQRGLMAQQTAEVGRRAPWAGAMRHLAGASPAELCKAILIQEILSAPLAERAPGPVWLPRL